MKHNRHFEQIIEPIVKKFGYEFIGLECGSSKRNVLLRVYIDKAKGISIDDCKKVSYQINQVLNVEEPNVNYTLEVSSPGINRKLYSAEQCISQIGKTIKITLLYPMDKKKNFKGILQDVNKNNILVQIEDGNKEEFNFEDIEKAQIVSDL